MEKNNLINEEIINDNNLKEAPLGNTNQTVVDIDQKKEEDKKNDDKNEKLNNNQMDETEEIEFEKYSRDKLLTEYFLQKFIIWKSDILILVVGNISLTEQKLLSRVKKEVAKLEKTKQIYVIHNLKDYSTEEQVNNYIENVLKKLFKIEIEENIYFF